MRYGLIGDNPLEKAAIASGMLPTPMLDGYAMVTTKALAVAATTSDPRRTTWSS